MFAGRTPGDKDLKEMLAEAPGPLNFTMFLSLFSEKLSGMLWNGHLYTVHLASIISAPDSA